MITISVVMPVYNVEIPILEEAVNSILNQTYQDYEFIIIDDGSSEDTRSYLEGLQDSRIRLIRNSAHLGITRSLNIGFREAKGKYIARMDGDDISLPARFEKQLEFMENHPDVIVCGTAVEFFGAEEFIHRRIIKDMESYRIRLLFSNPGPMHPTAFFNRALLDCYHIKYDESLEYAQDYGLWTVISRHGKVYILDDVLLRYRRHFRRVSSEFKNKQVQCDKLTKERLLRKLLGDVTQKEVDLHYKYGSGYFKGLAVNMEMYYWFRRLIKANNRIGIYNKKKFRNYVYNSIIKPAIYQSFSPESSYASKISAFFYYLPPFLALRASAGMTARAVLSRRK